jgi:hypothetical protein
LVGQASKPGARDSARSVPWLKPGTAISRGRPPSGRARICRERGADGPVRAELHGDMDLATTA